MAHTHETAAHPQADHPVRSGLRRVLLGLLYFCALSVLVVWEFRERFDVLSAECTLSDAPPRSEFYFRPYRRFLAWTSPEAPAHVAVVSIPLDLDEIQGNVCEARGYLADLVQTIASQHPAEIVIDKFFGPGTCTSNPAPTQELLAAARSAGIPVVVGESTVAPAEKTEGSCLVRRPQLDFGTSNVHRGLTRINKRAEMIPLQWHVLDAEPEEGHAPPAIRKADSLTWASVQAYDPSYSVRPRIQALIHSDRHPYARLDTELPHETSTQLLCAVGTDAMRKRWSADCSHPQTQPNLLGKIVLIGAESTADQGIVMGHNAWGYDLQARYIDAMLSGSYLEPLPFTASFLIFAVFIFFIEGLPTVLAAVRPNWKRHRFLGFAYKRRRYVWVIFWALIFMLASCIVPLMVRYLPPLDLLGDIAFVCITRLIFFIAESAEHPILHSHKKVG